VLLGDDLLPLIVLALGAAMVVGPVLALVRPREDVQEGELARPPLGRTLVFAAIGLACALWAIASLVR
jgi:hypothetical protein